MSRRQIKQHFKCVIGCTKRIKPTLLTPKNDFIPNALHASDFKSQFHSALQGNTLLFWEYLLINGFTLHYLKRKCCKSSDITVWFEVNSSFSQYFLRVYILNSQLEEGRLTENEVAALAIFTFVIL